MDCHQHFTRWSYPKKCSDIRLGRDDMTKLNCGHDYKLDVQWCDRPKLKIKLRQRSMLLTGLLSKSIKHTGFDYQEEVPAPGSQATALRAASGAFSITLHALPWTASEQQALASTKALLAQRSHANRTTNASKFTRQWRTTAFKNCYGGSRRMKPGTRVMTPMMLKSAAHGAVTCEGRMRWSYGAS